MKPRPLDIETTPTYNAIEELFEAIDRDKGLQSERPAGAVQQVWGARCPLQREAQPPVDGLEVEDLARRVVAVHGQLLQGLQHRDQLADQAHRRWHHRHAGSAGGRGKMMATSYTHCLESYCMHRAINNGLDRPSEVEMTRL